MSPGLAADAGLAASKARLFLHTRKGLGRAHPWALTLLGLSFQESRIYAVATSGMHLSDISPRSNATCCGECHVGCP